MSDLHPLSGIYAAALTPLKADMKLDLESIPHYLRLLASRGCHGVLLFGTTGEGPSFSQKERETLMRSVRVYRQQLPGFRLLAGTGTPSLSETIDLTRLAFDLGYDGVVVLPPYYFRKTSEQGLFEWFSQIITKSVPGDKYLLGYHIPGMTGVGFSMELLARLKNAFPNQFAGIKDSSHDANFAEETGRHFGKDLLVLNGTDSLLQHSLKNHGQGAITAAANLLSDDLRTLWDMYQEGEDTSEIQERVTRQRHVLERYTPFPVVLKALMPGMFDLPRWRVAPPLEDMPDEMIEKARQDFSAAMA